MFQVANVINILQVTSELKYADGHDAHYAFILCEDSMNTDSVLVCSDAQTKVTH